ncbi:hypothetical protein Taro_046912 [Colocasia esculenta]|uniref:Transmembrane protein n=1 Tax=Colocasia esculenta TaxID=4460 RepID=A0A843X6N6_COLES|nr:hypothetical protein [Colocasia esculenta]
MKDSCRQVQARCSWLSSVHLSAHLSRRLREPTCGVAFTGTELLSVEPVEVSLPCCLFPCCWGVCCVGCVYALMSVHCALLGRCCCSGKADVLCAMLHRWLSAATLVCGYLSAFCWLVVSSIAMEVVLLALARQGVAAVFAPRAAESVLRVLVCFLEPT